MWNQLKDRSCGYTKWVSYVLLPGHLRYNLRYSVEIGEWLVLRVSLVPVLYRNAMSHVFVFEFCYRICAASTEVNKAWRLIEQVCHFDSGSLICKGCLRIRPWPCLFDVDTVVRDNYFREYWASLNTSNSQSTFVKIHEYIWDDSMLYLFILNIQYISLYYFKLILIY